LKNKKGDVFWGTQCSSSSSTSKQDKHKTVTVKKCST